ncbi:MAG: ABC-F family ATP-binding cassette domain-containing protein [Ignavibacteria bacterium]|nr:ABC-F family ATP-binding cassette domain-containing protein [Ignavibacteria bacterium]MBK7413559.1 ABC-F family ATP-binding cassette domain-containing protein [Ignavibacteria bacterium]MBP7093174.1 ABC-F family ATP-binding cassette domain-containing protein [Candidatus Kapabacteria bacterium]
MITLTNVTVDFGTRILFKNVNFLIQNGDRIGLVGRNGAGKSTLLGIIAGETTPTGGDVSKQNGMRLGLLSQDLTLDLSKTLRETAMAAFEEVLRLHAEIEEIQHQLETRTDYETDAYMDLVQRLTDANDMYARRGGLTMHADIERVLTGLGFEAADLDKGLTAFSGGWQMRAELGRLLLLHPDCLLLDEPTNHLDIDSVRWLEDFLSVYDGAVVLISHDRTFLDNITNRTIEITKTKVYDIPASYSDYEEIRAERMEQQRALADRQTKERDRMQKWIDRFKYKASLASRAQSRIKALQRMEVIEVDDDDTSSIHFSFPPAPRSGRAVVECTGIVKSYGEKKVLRGVDFTLERGEKIAFIGKNGEGKTTLAKIIAGVEPPTAGEVQLGHAVAVGYYAQQQADMMGGHNTIYEVMQEAAPPSMRPRIRSLLGAFLFRGDDINKRVGVLSGGEKSRLALARLLLQPYNLLILDEPTNHLDMLSKEVLKEALMSYDGAMIVVSHDRDFLDGLTEKIIAFRVGTLKEYEGDVDTYLKLLGDPHVADAPAPHEIPLHHVVAPEKTSAQLREEQKARDKEKRKAERRVTEIENQIAVQEKTIAEAETKLADPDLYKDPVKQHKTTTTYDTAKRVLASLMEEWATLMETISQPTED